MGKINLGGGRRVEVAAVRNVNLDEEETYLEDGSRLTEARGEEIARETLREAAVMVGRRGGRPRKAAASVARHQKAVRLTDSQARALARMAGELQVSESQVVRMALAEFEAARA